MENAVALTALGIAGTAVGGIIYLAKWFANTLSKDLKEHTEAALKQAQSSDEVLKFMKNLNGKLEGAFVAKVKEKSRNRSN